MPDDEDASARSAAPQAGRDRLLIWLPIVLVGSFIVLFVSYAVLAAREAQVAVALGHQKERAQTIARRIDGSATAAQTLLRTLSDRADLSAALRDRDRATVQRRLRDVVDWNPDVLVAAGYGRDGALLTRVVAAPEIPAAWAARTADRRVSWRIVSSPAAGGKKTALLVTRPLESGVLLIGYRIPDWGAGTGEWIVSDNRGRVVDASGAAGAKGAEGRDRLTGQAPVRGPQWDVTAWQSIQDATAPIRGMLGRIALAGVALLALTGVTSRSLNRRYLQQTTMTQDLSEYNEQLKSVEKAKSDFLANVSHDLRTPLATMQMSLSSLLAHDITHDPATVRETLRLASDELQQLATKVRNLLEMSRIEARAYPRHRDVCDLTDIVGAALERLESVTRGRTIQTDFPRDRPLLFECNSDQIETVIVNLIENAVKYSPPGSTLFLSGGSRQGSVVFLLRDQGPGIQPGDEEKIFQKFYRSPSSVAVTGTGLGLAICKAIIVAHGGEIAAENAPIGTGGGGGGAQIGFSVPALDDQGHQLSQVGSAPRKGNNA